MASDRDKSITLRAFAKLGNEKLLHSYCDILRKLLGLVVDFISAENETLRLSSGSNFNAYCAAIRESCEGAAACHRCDVVHGLQGARCGEAVCYRCHAGLYEVVVPLFDGRKAYLGCLTSGQFHLRGEKKNSRGEVHELARLYGLDPEALFEAYRNSPTLSPEQLEGVISYLKVIGTHLTGLRENLIFLEKIDTPVKIESIRRYLEENYTQKLLIRDVARRFYVSESFLSHNFKRELNVSFTDYINAFRVNKARELLADTRLQVSEIAMVTGFGSISQFNRVFMAEVGVSAKEYRRTVRQKNTGR